MNASGILTKLAFENISECKDEADRLKAVSSIVVMGLFDKEIYTKPAGRPPAGTSVM